MFACATHFIACAARGPGRPAREALSLSSDSESSGLVGSLAAAAARATITVTAGRRALPVQVGLGPAGGPSRRLRAFRAARRGHDSNAVIRLGPSGGLKLAWALSVRDGT